MAPPLRKAAIDNKIIFLFGHLEDKQDSNYMNLLCGKTGAEDECQDMN